MKYAFIRRHCVQWPIMVQCRVLRVSAAGYHEHIARQRVQVLPLPVAPRYLSDTALLVHIRAIHAESKQTMAGRGSGVPCTRLAYPQAGSAFKGLCSAMAYGPKASGVSGSPRTAITTCR